VTAIYVRTDTSLAELFISVAPLSLRNLAGQWRVTLDATDLRAQAHFKDTDLRIEAVEWLETETHRA